VRSLHGVSEAAAAEAYFNASLVLAALVTLLFLFWCGEYGSLLEQLGGIKCFEECADFHDCILGL